MYRHTYFVVMVEFIPGPSGHYYLSTTYLSNIYSHYSLAIPRAQHTVYNMQSKGAHQGCRMELTGK